MSETEKLLLYGVIGFVAYKLLTARPAYVPGAAPRPVPTPGPSQAEQISDAAISVARSYGVQQCIDQGYDPATCRSAGAAGGGLLDSLFNL